MKITNEWLEEKSACSSGKEWFLAQKETDGVKVVKKLIKANKLDWANWLIVRIMDYKQYVSYAVYAAEQVIDLYERRYPKDERPRQAIEAAKKCIDNPTQENKNAAYAAAFDAAYAAAFDAVDAAANAANAANAAANAANAAAYAAANAAANAAFAAYAAYDAMKKKILLHGLKLLKAR